MQSYYHPVHYTGTMRTERYDSDGGDNGGAGDNGGDGGDGVDSDVRL